MSGGIKALELNAEDARKCLAAKLHLGSPNCKYQMKQYVYRRGDAATGGAHILNLQKVWEKINLVARIIVAVENPLDVCVVSAKEQGQRAIIKFAKFCGTSQISGRFSPGSFTNHSQAGYREPRILIVTDPAVDHQAIREASYVNIPVVSLCDVDSDLKYIDVVIPCNNKAAQPIGLVWWFLTREVLRLRGLSKGGIARSQEWDIMPDLFFYRSQKDIEEQEKVEAKKDEELNMAPEDADGFQAEVPENIYGEGANQEWDAKNEQAPADWTVDVPVPEAGAQANDWATTPENASAAAAGW